MQHPWGTSQVRSHLPVEESFAWWRTINLVRTISWVRSYVSVSLSERKPLARCTCQATCYRESFLSAAPLKQLFYRERVLSAVPFKHLFSKRLFSEQRDSERLFSYFLRSTLLHQQFSGTAPKSNFPPSSALGAPCLKQFISRSRVLCTVEPEAATKTVR